MTVRVELESREKAARQAIKTADTCIRVVVSGRLGARIDAQKRISPHSVDNVDMAELDMTD